MPTKTVLITGCSSGIGAATARAFRDDGWEVYATDPDPSAMTELEDAGCTTAKLDVTEDDDARSVVADVIDEHGRIDCVFNNAGYGQIGPIEEVPTDRVVEQFEVNFFGQHRVLRAALPYMRDQGEGTIVNNSSVYGRTVFPGQGAYAGSKWAVEAMSDTLRVELLDTDVDVAVIEPGPVETNFGERALDERTWLDDTGAYEWVRRLYDPDQYDRWFIDRAVGHVQPERVADAVVDIANDDDPRRRYVIGPWKYAILVGYLVPDAVRDRLLNALRHLPNRD